MLIGAQDLTDPNNVVINAYNAYIHPEWDERTLVNDIAILELEQSIDWSIFNGTVRPVCLPNPDEASSGIFFNQCELHNSEPRCRKHVSCSPTIIKYIFNSFLFSKSSLNKNLLNIYLIEVDESDNGCQIGLHEIYISIKTVYLIFRSK